MTSPGTNVEIPKFMDGYPPPTPPKWKKKDSYDEEKMKAVDAKAKEVKLGNETYEQLAEKLTNGYETDLEKVRALFTWLGSQNTDSLPSSKTAGKATPLCYLTGLFGGNNNFTWAEGFAQLCRAANLPCVIIDGNSKGASYEVGQQDVSFNRNSWNGVYVDGSWQIVHPHWAFTAVSNYNTGKWTKIETEGKATREKSEESKGTGIRTVTEKYFCPDPEHFIYKCIAEKKEWQLVRKPIDLHTFCNVPQFELEYFSSTFKLTSAHDAILKSVDGKCQMEFDQESESRFHLGYELFFDEKNSKEELPAGGLPKYIFYETKGPKLRILIRFRLIGIYKLSIKAGITIFHIRLDATEKSRNENWLPVNPPIGYGYGHTAEKVGLKEPSQRSGVVVMQQYQVEEFSFKMTQVTQIVAKMRHVRKDSASLSQYVMKSIKGNNVSIKVTMPDREEYALQVYREAEREEYNVLNYLLTTSKRDFQSLDETKKLVEVRKRMDEARVRRNLETALMYCKPKPLESSVSAFESAKLKDTHGKLRRAKTMIDGMNKEKKTNENIKHYRQNLQTAMKKRDLDQLKTAISDAQKSGYKELEDKIEKAENRAIAIEMEDINKARAESLLEDLRTAREANTIDKLEDAISAYKKEQLPDHRDLTGAVRDLVQLYESAVVDAGDDVKRLEELLEEARQSSVADDLEKSDVLNTASAHLRQRKRLGGKILKLEHSTVCEIQAYRNPKPVAVDTMRCTFILLGEDPRKLASWTDIQKRLRPNGDIVQKMNRLRTDKLHPHQLERARELLYKYKLDDAKEVSAGIAAFFQWNNKTVADASK